MKKKTSILLITLILLNAVLSDLTLVTLAATNKVTVEFDSTVPYDAQTYIKKLIQDIEPEIINVLGEPLKNTFFKVIYNPNEHLGFRDNKTILIINKLPKDDSNFDAIFTINYIHKYLEGINIPIPGTRYFESLAHPIKEIVAENLAKKNIRYIEHKGLKYYVDLYNIVKHLPGDIILNQGVMSTTNSSFDTQNFMLDDTTYSIFNWFTLEYAKAIWLKLYYERYLYANKYDFFKELRNKLYMLQPQDKQQFIQLIANLIPQIGNMTPEQWVNNIGLFQGKITNHITLSCILFSGYSMHSMFPDNPYKIVPLLVSRTPGKLLLGEKIHIDILNKNQKVFSTDYIMHLIDNTDELEPVQIPYLQDGEYDIILTYKDLQYTNKLIIGDYIPERNTTVNVTYDSSVPIETQNYINNLIKDITPIYKEIIGDPMQNTSLKITYNPQGYASLNGDMSVLNITQLPNNSKNDPNFDAFFLIEYSHMYYKNIDIPIPQLRFNEGVGQALKVIIGNILKQRKIRNVSVQDIDYYLNVFNYTNRLDAGILINNGIDIMGNHPHKNLLWDAKSKYMPFMNVFTLNYHYLPIWLKLFDARIKQYNKNDFFKLLVYNTEQRKINNINDLCDFVDRYCKYVDNKIASEWIKNISILKDITDKKYFLDMLPINGDNLFYINDIKYPNKLYIFLVKRDPYADIMEYPVKIKIYQNNELRFETTYVANINNYDYNYVTLPSWIGNNYKIIAETEIDGQHLIKEIDNSKEEINYNNTENTVNNDIYKEFDKEISNNITTEINNISKKTLKLNYTKKMMIVKQSFILKVIEVPVNINLNNLVWYNNNPKVVKLDKNGKITALKKGTAIITVKTKDNKYIVKCIVTVKEYKY